MVFYIAMKKRVTAHRKSQRNHSPFKCKIVDDIDTK